MFGAAMSAAASRKCSGCFRRFSVWILKRQEMADAGCGLLRPAVRGDRRFHSAQHFCTRRVRQSRVHLDGLSTAEIVGRLEPLDLIVWNGHVLIVLDRHRLIESRPIAPEITAE